MITIRRLIDRSRSSLFVVALIACSSHGGGDAARRAAGGRTPSVATLKGIPLVADPAMGIIRGLTLSHGHLWIVDFGQEPFFHIVDTATWHIVVSRGRRGSGPADFGSVRDIFRVGGASTDVWAYDMVRRRVQRLMDDGRPEPAHTIELGSTNRIIGITPVRDGWIGWNADLDSTERYVGFDDHGKIVFTTSAPFLGDSTESPLQRQHASVNHVLCARPSGDRFAVLYGYAGRIEIRGPRAELITLADVPEPSNGDFSTVPGGGRIWRDKRYYYHGCTATDDHLFALASGNPIVDGQPHKTSSDAEAARTIEVFDWTGRFVSLLAVDHALKAISISENGQWLYGGGADSSVVFRFHLPPIPNAPQP